MSQAQSYWIGPWQWRDNRYVPPAGATSSIDLRTLPEMSAPEKPGGFGLFVSQASVRLPAEYRLLGTGHATEIRPNPVMRSAIAKAVRYVPQGDSLSALIWTAMTNGADPEGYNAPRPLDPGTSAPMELHLGGLIGHSRFRWGLHRHTNRLRDLKRRDFAEVWDRDERRARKVLGGYVEKYRADWRQFVPPRLLPHVPGPLVPETTYTDNFNRADSSNLGADWTEVAGDQSIESNHLAAAFSAASISRSGYAHDLSTTDHYTQIVCTHFTPNDSYIGGLVRYDTAADTCYYGLLYWSSSTSSNRLALLGKFVGGTSTGFTSPTITVSQGDTEKTTVSGSTLKCYQNGAEVTSTTDTSITTGLRGGVGIYNGKQEFSVSTWADDFETADLAAGGSSVGADAMMMLSQQIVSAGGVF